MPFRTSSGTFSPALRPGLSAGTLQHVILRGLERGQIVADAQDREAFVARLGALAAATGTMVYAWALLPNHAPLLLHSGAPGLPQFMRRLLVAA